MSEFQISLVDHVTESANRMAASVGALSKAMKGLGGAVDDADKATKKSAGWSKVGESFAMSASPAKGLEKGLEGLSKAAGGLGAALNPVTLTIAAVAAAAA